VKQQKVLFPFELGAESMWADDLGNNRYRLDNVPLFAYGISYGDEFTARRREEEQLYFERVLSRGGAWTYRATLNDGMSHNPEAMRLIDEITSRARLNSKYGDGQFAFSFPDAHDRVLIESLFEKGTQSGFWDWEISSSPTDSL
jgi:hypothetical protein